MYILSDCTAAIDMVIHRSRFLKMPDLYNRLKSVQESLLAPNISVGLYHGFRVVRIASNECADKFVKQMAYSVSSWQTGQRPEADRIEFTDEDTALQCSCHLRTVIWLGDMDSRDLEG